MRVAVIGAGGFLGARVVQELAAQERVSEIRAVDRAAMRAGPKAQILQGDFSDPALRGEALKDVDAVIHLAAILGGGAEGDPALARRVNIDATLDLVDALTGSGARFVFASTVAALRTPMPAPVTDAAPLGSALLYGAQKQMIEVLLSHHAAKGWLDAVSLRPAGIMARDGADAALKSAFMSRLFYAVARGEDISLPVAADSRTWLASVRNVAQNFVQAALLPDLGPERAFTLPALSLRFGDLVAALKARFPQSPARVTYAPDPQIIALFGAMPDLITETADRLGFARDADAAALVEGALEETET
jgi:nucleoside-diphosphate-sugar epimerase